MFARENPFELPQSTSAQKEQPSAAETTLIAKPAAAKEQQKEPTSSVVEKKPETTQQPKITGMGQKVADLGFIAIYREGNILQLRTNDPLKRSFVIDKPTKGVFDFAAKRRFASKNITLDEGPFKRISLGAHKNFYRVVIEVQKGCKPTITELQLICR